MTTTGTAARPWHWTPTESGDIELRDEAGQWVASIFLLCGRRAVDAAAGGWDVSWPAFVRNREPGRHNWSLVGTSLDDCYLRVETAIGRPTVRWHPPTGDAG